MPIEFLNLDNVSDIVHQSSEKLKQIKETERLLAVATEAFKIRNFNRSNIKKLIAEIKGRNIPLEQLNFDVVKGVVILSETSNEVDQEIRNILAPLISRNLDATSIEKSTRTELAALKKQAQAAGVSASSFENMVKRAAYESENKSFYVVKKEGYIFFVSNNDPGMPSVG